MPNIGQFTFDSIYVLGLEQHVIHKTFWAVVILQQPIFFGLLTVIKWVLAFHAKIITHMTASHTPSDNDLLAKAQLLQRDGQLADAISIFRKLLPRHAQNPRLLYLAGTAALQAGLDSEAIDYFHKSLSIDPNQSDAQCHLGVAHWNRREFKLAEAAYRTAIALDNQYPEAYNNLCMVMQDGFKNPEQALTLIDRAIEIRPDYADAYNNRGNVLQALNRFEDALTSYDRSITLKPDSASAHNNRGNTLRKLDRVPEALAAYQKAIAIKPDYAEAYCNMGCALADLNEVDDARRFYQYTLALDPGFAKAHYNLGGLENATGNHDLAFKLYDKAISLDPGFADAYWNKSLLKLLHGDYKEGFALYEWGWSNHIRGNRRGFKQPEWLGKESLSGKRLLIHQEQGIGDCIHYARYVHDAVAMGAEVTLEAVGPLIPFLKSMNVPCNFVAMGETLPSFDCYIPLMSLPLAFGTTIQNLSPSVPYLFPEKTRTELWSQRLGPKTKPRIGLVWSGSTLHKNDRNRSMSLKELLPLFSLPCEFHCLQKEIRPEDAQCLPALPMIHTHESLIDDFADTAAIVDLMDVVISVDTSVAHVSGAIGQKTWILLPLTPDWRWLLDREDSPWYPTVRLFRQSTAGNWEDVVTHLRQALVKDFNIAEAHF